MWMQHVDAERSHLGRQRLYEANGIRYKYLKVYPLAMQQYAIVEFLETFPVWVMLEKIPNCLQRTINSRPLFTFELHWNHLWLPVEKQFVAAGILLMAQYEQQHLHFAAGKWGSNFRRGVEAPDPQIPVLQWTKHPARWSRQVTMRSARLAGGNFAVWQVTGTTCSATSCVCRSLRIIKYLMWSVEWQYCEYF